MGDYSPSEKVEAEFEDALKRCYPEFHKNESEITSEAEKVIRVIQYSKSKSIIGASVKFFQGQKNWSAVFEYDKKSQPNQRESCWYCVRDWND